MEKTIMVCEKCIHSFCPFGNLTSVDSLVKKYCSCNNEEYKKPDDWKSRLLAEYKETKNRYEKLHEKNVKSSVESPNLIYNTASSIGKEANLLCRQEKVMREYLDVLEMRMTLANIPF